MRQAILGSIAFILLTAPALAQDMKKGLKAYKSGDYATAVKEWRPLAEQGHAGAQYNLGFNYVQGKGVPEDLVQAYFWFDLAARQGRGIAQQLRDGIAKKMTVEQVRDARAKVSAWLAAHPKLPPR
ncbi:MAG: sel1 repeat family protein [Alphaproteobacteria bacterium]|nr:sel1 repeat family protein [Alphaproteobacteria bacterium]